MFFETIPLQMVIVKLCMQRDNVSESYTLFNKRMCVFFLKFVYFCFLVLFSIIIIIYFFNLENQVEPLKMNRIYEWYTNYLQ